MDKQISNECDGCSSTSERFTISEGFVVCQDCGTCNDVDIDSGAEWRCFANERGGMDTSVVRCANASSSSKFFLPDSYMSVMLTSDSGKRKSGGWITLTSKERNIQTTMRELSELGREHSISPEIIRTTMHLYCRFCTLLEMSNAGVKRCTVRQGIKAACLYYAFREAQQPREKKEIIAMFKVAPKVVTKGLDLFKVTMGKEYSNSLDIVHPSEYLGRYCESLRLSYKEQLIIKEDILTRALQLKELEDVAPSSLIAACLFYASEEKLISSLSIDTISKTCGTSPSMIRRVAALLIGQSPRSQPCGPTTP